MSRAFVGGSTGWRILVLVVCVVAGLLVATTREVSAGNEIRARDTTRVSDLVRSAQANADEASAERDALAAQVEQLQHSAASSNHELAAVLGDIEALSVDSGRTAMIGPGITVTMTDAPRGADGRYPADATPNDLVVHQHDVQAVLNALWAGGAEAMSMQDQRLIATSAPRCIGNTLLLHGRTYSPPYVISAIGDPARLQAALDNSTGIRVFKQYAVRFGLGYAQDTSGELTIPAYSGD
ncbi:MAG: DUF881 domain-containing protein [Rhodococcus sp.]|nr:DUF881 domain-containing protein [Rhodococcus sp. (in: high G+C Gram-positive bacteria)]